jgi:uncharacterized protein
MEAAEAQKPIIANAEKEAADTRALVQRQLSDIAAKVNALDSQIAEAQADREKLVADVDEDLLDTYQRLFEKKDGLAVAALSVDTCHGCHVKAQTHIVNAVKAAKEVTHCLNCGRILYLEP